MALAAWVLVFVLIMIFFYQWHQKVHQPNTNLQSAVIDGVSQVILYPDPQNHYVFPGKINQSSVNFLLDTGASDVVIPLGVAKRLRLPQGHAQTAQTAAGSITVYKTRLKELVIGSIRLYDVRASINPHMADHHPLLLGMSALKSLHMEQQPGQLLLRAR